MLTFRAVAPWQAGGGYTKRAPLEETFETLPVEVGLIRSTRRFPDILRVPARWVYDHVARGELKVVRVGRYYRFTREDIRTYIQARRGHYPD